MNAELNGVKLEVDQSNLVGEDGPWDCILVGDMFYDPEFSSTLLGWLSRMAGKGKTVLIGDAGRLRPMTIERSERLKLLLASHLPEYLRAENDGVSTVQVWSF